MTRRKRPFALAVALGAVMVLAGCRGETCARHSDCAAGESCALGECVVPCGGDGDCPIDETCNDGQCGEAREAGRSEPCDAEAGCGDAAADASATPDATPGVPPRDAGEGADDAAPDLPDTGPPVDASPRGDGALDPDADAPAPDATPRADAGADAAAPDAEVPPDAAVPDATAPDLDAGPPEDAAPPDAAEPDAAEPDAAPPRDAAPPVPDGEPPPRPIDMTATYTLTRTVLLSGDPALRGGTTTETTVRVRRVARPIYRVELLDPDGRPALTIEEARFFFPEGREMFQLTFDLPEAATPPAPAGCTRLDAWFERGDLEGEGPYTMRAIAEQHVDFEGEACAAEDFLVVYATEWRPVAP